MKRHTLWIILVSEAALCLLSQSLKANFAGMFSSALAFPFEQIGLGLRALSLSGWIGNIAALLIYTALSLGPAAALLVLARRKKLQREDWLLAIMSVALFAVLYLMVNPALIGSLLGGSAGLPMGKAVLGATMYSLLCGYIVLRLLRLFFTGNTAKLHQYMAILLCLLNLLFVWLVSGTCFGKLLDSVAALQAGNTGNESFLGASYVFMVLQFFVDALPYMLDIFVVFGALRLMDNLRVDRYSQESVEAVSRLSRLCGSALAATVLSNIVFNLMQVLYANILLVVNTSVQFPVFSIAFVLAVLLLARYIAENKRLKDDNDMFI